MTFSTDTAGTNTFRDYQNDAISRTGYDITPTQTFMTINSALDTLTITNPSNAEAGNYSVSIYCRDNHTDTGYANMTFNVEITLSPGCQVASTPSNQSFIAHTNTTIVTTGIGMFSHANSEPISITGHTFSPSNTFLSLSSDNTTVTISDPQNADIGNYSLSIFCQDPHSDTGTANNTFVIEITENVGCQVSSALGNQSFVAHTNTTLLATSLFTDPNSEALTLENYTFTPSVSFLSLSADNTTITISDPQNVDVGNYTFEIY